MTPDEEWRPIAGWENLYEVSDRGRVRSLDRFVGTRLFAGRIRALPTSGRYARLVLKSGARKETRDVHVLVAEAFLGPRPSGMDVCHNDGDSFNNRLSNLRYDTSTNNHYDTVRHGRNPSAIKTHCPSGHEYSPENTGYQGANRGRYCRTCDRAQQKRRRDAARQT